MRREDLKAESEEGKYRTLTLLQQFILKGKYQDKRRGHESRISELGKLGKRRRESFYISVRSYFTHNRLWLPSRGILTSTLTPRSAPQRKQRTSDR